jgi:heme exporter protein D
MSETFVYIALGMGVLFVCIYWGCSKILRKKSLLTEQSQEASDQRQKECEIRFRQQQHQQQILKIDQKMSNRYSSNKEIFTIQTSSNSSKFDLPPPSYESVINQQNQKSF